MFKYLFLFSLWSETGTWWNFSLYRLRACHDIFSVLCTVYSLLLHCFIWTFLTRIVLNYARWGAVWQPLKMKYLLVFSQARDQWVWRFTSEWRAVYSFTFKHLSTKFINHSTDTKTLYKLKIYCTDIFFLFWFVKYNIRHTYICHKNKFVS